MKTVTITLRDMEDGLMAMDLTIEGGFDDQSAACQAANSMLNHLDSIGNRVPEGLESAEEAPKVIISAEDINQRRAQTIAHIPKTPQIILAH